jgi:hypothetical protein
MDWRDRKSPPLTPADRERFEAKVYRIPGGGCWVWLASTQSGGYGQFWVGSRMELAHRVAWTLYRGPIPPGLCVLHNCPGGDDRACVNPAHLWLGTILDNSLDMARKGRSRRGSFPFGVLRRENGRFTARVSINGEVRYLGTYDTIEQAHEVALVEANLRPNPNPYVS